MKLFVRKQRSTVLFLLTLLTLFGTSKIGYAQADANRAPVFNEGARATRSVAENTPAGTNIGAPFTATDPDDGDTLTYSLHRGDKNAFRIDPNTGQLQTRAALDYEAKSAYGNLAVRVTDSGGLTDAILVTINVTNVNEMPDFNTFGRLRAVAENTPPGRNIGEPFTATDPDGDALTYSLHNGEDKDAFDIVSTTGQLQTKDALDYETKNDYTFTISVSDSNGRSLVRSVTINVTNVNEAPSFTEGSSAIRTVAENTVSGENIGTAVAATDDDSGDTLTYTLGGMNAASFSIDSTSGQLRAKAALDYETKASYSVTVTVSDGNDGGSDSIDVTIHIMGVNENRAPSFTDGTASTRTIAEDTVSGENIGTAISATDADSDTLTYALSGTDASSFSIVSTSGQLQTSAALDYETKPSYSVRVTVSDGEGGSDSIPVMINVSNVNEAPSFTEGSSAARAVAENTASDENIGTAVAATDVDANTILTYTLSGTDADSFSIVSTSGQLQTRAALDYEAKMSYSVTVTVSDGSLSDSITVTITVTDVSENTAPVFTEGTSTTRSVAENTAAGTNIGTAVAATDADNDTLTYTLSSTDAAAFSIVSTSGQLQTNTALDYETKASYSVTVSVSDGNGGTDSITVTINVTDVAEIEPPLSERTPEVRDAIFAGIPGVYNADNVTAAHLAVITTLTLNSEDITSLKLGDFNGLTGLTDLDLGGTSISNISVLEGLTTLIKLDLSGTSISNISVLENMTKLTDLDLSSTSISDVSALEDLTKLTRLSLNFTSISDVSALEDLTKLTRLNLDGTSISDVSALEDLTKLTRLSLNFTSISDVSALEDLTALTTLGLNYTSISDISALENMTKLTTLGLQSTSISDISVLENMTKLTLLNLGYNSISDVSALEDLTKLTRLSLTGNPISDYGPLRRLIAAIQADGRSLALDITIPVEDAARVAPSVETSPIIPDRTALLTNFPNPFNPETWIPYQLAKPAEVTLTIYDIRGVVVRELKLGHQAAGMYHSRSDAIYWDGSNAFGEKVATGVYFYTLKVSGEFTATRKLLIRK